MGASSSSLEGAESSNLILTCDKWDPLPELWSRLFLLCCGVALINGGVGASLLALAARHRSQRFESPAAQATPRHHQSQGLLPGAAPEMACWGGRADPRGRPHGAGTVLQRLQTASVPEGGEGAPLPMLDRAALAPARAPVCVGRGKVPPPPWPL